MREKKVKSPKNSRDTSKGFQITGGSRYCCSLRAGRTSSLTRYLRSFRAIKTFSEHTRRLVAAGLVEKSYAGRMVQHNLTPYGRIFVDFIRKFANQDSDKDG